MGFFERSDMPRPDAFPLLGVRHILLLLLLTGCITAGLLLIRRLKPSQAQHVLHGAAILVPLLELSHSVWLYLTGTTSLIKLLPLHLCGLQSLFIPLAVFTKFTCFRDFVYATSLLGGIFGTVMPAGVADFYPLLSFQTLQTFALHGLLIFVPLAMILCGQHRPSIQRFPRVLCIFLLAAFVVGIGPNVWRKLHVPVRSAGRYAACMDFRYLWPRHLSGLYLCPAGRRQFAHPSSFPYIRTKCGFGQSSGSTAFVISAAQKPSLAPLLNPKKRVSVWKHAFSITFLNSGRPD